MKGIFFLKERERKSMGVRAKKKKIIRIFQEERKGKRIKGRQLLVPI